MNHLYNKLIYILGGGLVKDKENGKWRTTNFDEGDEFGALGDRLRVVAGSELYKEQQDQIIIVSGGKGQYKDIADAPTIASVMKEELISLGVPEEDILLEEESGSSWEQIQGLRREIEKRRINNVKMISNRFHLPRLAAMFEKDSELSQILRDKTVELVSAEQVLIEKEPNEWESLIQEAYESEAMKKRIELEEKGIRDLKENRYKLN